MHAIDIGIGLAAGCIPIAGYNIGAERKDRAKQLFTYLLAAEAATGIIALLIVELLPYQLIGIFGAGSEAKKFSPVSCSTWRTLCGASAQYGRRRAYGAT